MNHSVLLRMENISNVIASDFNYDGALDLMVLTKTDQKGKYEIKLFVQDLEKGNLSE